MPLEQDGGLLSLTADVEGGQALSGGPEQLALVGKPAPVRIPAEVWSG
ncbi:hypothetical protein ACWCZ5_03490 [Streptomyces sp. NPDC001667]